MASEPDRQKVLGQGLVKAVKLTELGEVLKGPELLFLFSKKFDQLYVNGILNLEALYQELRTTKGVELSTLQGFLLWFKDQEANLGVAMQLPADLLLLSADKRGQLKGRIAKQVAEKISARPHEEPAAVQAKVERVVLGRKKSRFRTIGIVVVAVLIAVSVVVNVQQNQPPKPDALPVEQIDLAALKLPGRLVTKQDAFLLRVQRAEWQQIPRVQLEPRLRALQTALLALGMKTLVVLDDTTWQTLAIGGEKDLVFIDGPSTSP